MTLKPMQMLVIAAVVFAIAVPALQMGLGLGLSAKQFADDGNETLRAAGYAFSIWSVIYIGLIAYAIWQALPRNQGDTALTQIAGPAAIAITGCGLWIIASSADWKWASVAIIVASAASLTLGLIRTAPSSSDLRSRLLVWWPLSLLAGWLTIASAINILTVLTAEGLLEGLTAPAAYLGIAAVTGGAMLVIRGPRLAMYGVPIAWGLAAVWVAERAEKPTVAVAALVAAALVAVYAAVRAWATPVDRDLATSTT